MGTERLKLPRFLFGRNLNSGNPEVFWGLGVTTGHRQLNEEWKTSAWSCASGLSEWTHCGVKPSQGLGLPGHSTIQNGSLTPQVAAEWLGGVTLFLGSSSLGDLETLGGVE